MVRREATLLVVGDAQKISRLRVSSLRIPLSYRQEGQRLRKKGRVSTQPLTDFNRGCYGDISNDNYIISPVMEQIRRRSRGR